MGSLVRTSIETLMLVTITPPKDPDDTATKIEMFLWQEKAKKYRRKQELLKEKLEKAYSMVRR